jgi:hypothetical protein
MRRVSPAPPARPRYPRLAAAWALLLGAAPSVAHADATVPAPGKGKGQNQQAAAPQPAAVKPPCPVKTGGKPISPKPADKRREKEPVFLGGDIAHAAAPLPPRFADLVLHPHDVGEPCFPLDFPKKDA